MALGTVQPCEVVQARGHIGMVGADVLFCNSECLLGDADSTVLLPLLVEQLHLFIEGVPFD